MAQYIILAVAALVIIGAVVYIIRQKKKGVKCIGCPHSKNCSCDCGSVNNKK